MNPQEKQLLLGQFLEELEDIHPLPAELKENLLHDFVIVHAPKDAILLHEGDVCKYAWVVLNGLVRAFHFVNGVDVTSRLMKPHHIIISVGSFYSQTPSFESVQVLQPTILARLHYHQLEHLYQRFPSFNYTGRKLTEQYFYLVEKRLFMLRKHTALERYKYFLEQYPGLINEIPLKYVASFLSMNQETLSRVRNKMKGG